MPQSTHEKNAIRNLQTYLRQLSYHNPAISAPPIDGIFDTATQAALREFQQAYGLPVTGTADQAVWELLYTVYRSSLAENSPPLKMDIFPRFPQSTEYGPGAQGFVVTAIQFILQELEQQYGNLAVTQITGTYDENTAMAVQTFQGKNRLQPTGLVNRMTWDSMVDQYNVMYTRFPEE